MYKSNDRKINELPISEITLTLVRHRYPREMIKALEKDGFAVTSEAPGIYKIDGRISITTQLVVTSQLPANEYTGLKLLVGGCTEEDVKAYSRKAIASNDENIKEHASSVIEVCLKANKKITAVLREENAMDAVIARIFKPEIDKAAQRAINRTRKEVATDMLKDGMPLPQIVKFSKLPEATVTQLAKSLGVAVL
ncbi:MAG: hypothetical protein IJ849_10375 [Selenomonadaceae bacterium]|nr:hypothetical protein [Selenomonadaceae bacterium]